MAGFGNSPVGTSPFGLGQPTTTAEPPTVKVLAGLATPGCRYLDPNTRDYVHDDDSGQLAQMPTTRQRVLLALLTVKGSSTVLPNLGVRMPRKITEAFERETQHAVQSALHRLTVIERVVAVRAIKVERLAGTGRVGVTVEFVDLTTGEEDAVSSALS